MRSRWESVKPINTYGIDTYCFYEKLSNGQVLGVYFQHDCEKEFNCAVTIQDSKEECDVWKGQGDIIKITGRCGIEGLIQAYRIIKWFITNRLPNDFELRIHGYDKRGSAYRYLTRLGFKVDVKEVSSYLFEKSYHYIYRRELIVS